MILLLALLALKAQAVGLGELIIHSKLGEQLNAEIPVVQQAGEFVPADEMFVNITSHGSEEQTVNAYYAKQTIKLKLEETLDNDVVLKLSSNKPINEPILDFLLEFKWKTGRLIKEYVILLDPPGFVINPSIELLNNKTPQTINNVVSQKQAVQKASLPNNRHSRTNITNTPFNNGKYGPVQQGETLSEIAMRVRPDGYHISLVRMMSVILSLNNDAFVDKNPDLLMQGMVLNIPDIEQILSFDHEMEITHPGTQTNLQIQPEHSLATLSGIDETLDINKVKANHTGTEQFNTTQVVTSGLKLSNKLDLAFLNNVLTSVSESASLTTEEKIFSADSIENETGNISNITETLEDKVNLDVAVIEPIEEETLTNFESTIQEVNEVEITTPPIIEPTAVTLSENNQTLQQPYNLIYLYISIAGLVIFVSMSGLWFFTKRTKETITYSDFSTTSELSPLNIPASIKKSVASQNVKPDDLLQEDQEPLVLGEGEETSANSEITEEDYTETVLMSHEEFKAIGIHKTDNSSEQTLTDNEIENISSSEDESLIKDYLDTVELPIDILSIDQSSDEQDPDEHDIEQSIADEAIEFVHSESAPVMDISITHEEDNNDDDTNSIIDEILQGEDYASNTHEPELVEDVEKEELVKETDTLIDINSYSFHEKETTNSESKTESVPVIELEETIKTEASNNLIIEQNIEDLIINFQNNSPEKEFEREVSVFMAYGDYKGAQDIIEKALDKDPENNSYKLALLSLYKATGKFGAALELCDELNTNAETLSEEDQKKLELLNLDLHEDKQSNIAS